MAPQTIPGHSGRVKAVAGGRGLCKGVDTASLERLSRGCWGGSLEGCGASGRSSGSGSNLLVIPGFRGFRKYGQPESWRPFSVREQGFDPR